MKRLSKRTKQSFISAAIVLVVAIITIFVFRAVNQNNNSDTTNPAASSNTHSSTYESEKSQNQYKTPEPDSEPAPEPITGILSYASLAGGVATINFAIDQYLTSGTCNLDFAGVTATSEIETSVATSTCRFAIPADNFEEGRRYPYVINITAGDQTGSISGEANF